MVVHWETSLKSLYVRTVWIDGRRHAILSKDDPVANTICPIVTSISRSSRGSSPESTMSSSSLSSQQTDLTLNANPLNLSNIKSSNQYNKYEQQRIIIDNKNYNHTTNKNKNEENLNQEKNPLSERVLQWLDLAGRENLNLGIDNFEMDELKKYENDVVKYESRRNSSHVDSNNNNNAKKHKKHFHRINKKYNKFNEIDISDDEEDCNMYNTYLFNPPMVSNDLLNYAKKTLNNTEIRCDMTYTFKAPIPSNLITFDNDDLIKKNKIDSASQRLNKPRYNNDRRPQTTNIMNMRNRLNEESEEENVKSKQSVGKCFESQYLELVRKRISENSYNMRAARRQLHIFIPSLPKQTICDSTASSILTVDD